MRKTWDYRSAGGENLERNAGSYKDVRNSNGMDVGWEVEDWGESASGSSME